MPMEAVGGKSETLPTSALFQALAEDVDLALSQSASPLEVAFELPAEVSGS